MTITNKNDGIRICDITRPTSESIIIFGKVTRCYDTNNFEKSSMIKCSNCGHTIQIDNKFPYDKLKLPKYCPESKGGCGKYRSICKFNYEVNNEKKNWGIKTNIFLHDGTTSFMLILLGDNTPPNVGDLILFKAKIRAKFKAKSPIIKSWTGETTEFTLIDSEHSSEVIA